MDTETQSPAAEPWPPPHKTFQKIPRLGRMVTITEKLDGTNALVAIHHDPAMPLAIGSRNRWLTPGKTSDNYDFCRWVLDNEESIRRLGPGWHYGEWWGIGIARRYNIGERRWSLFDTRWTEDELRARGLPANVHVVPTLATQSLLEAGHLFHDPIMACVHRLQNEGSIAAPGFMNPEGIVIRHAASGHLYKWTFGGDGVEAKKDRRADDVPAVVTRERNLGGGVVEVTEQRTRSSLGFGECSTECTGGRCCSG